MLLAAFISAMISCSTSDGPSHEDEKPTGQPQLPIDFRLDASSRAVDLSTIYDNFCVRAFKKDAAGTKSIVIPNYRVMYTDGKWIYSGVNNPDGSSQFLKYWDLSADSYTFAAVAPATSADASYSIDDNGMVTIDIASLSTEWMIARTIRRGVNDASALLDYDDITENIEDINQSPGKTSTVFKTPNSPYADVPLNFHSILAKVVIKVYAESEIQLSPLEVGFNNIGVTPATYNSVTGWTTTPIDYQQLYRQNTLITAERNSREKALQLIELLVVPQQQTDAENRPLQIKVKTDNNDNPGNSFDIPAPWQPNTTYIYYLKFGSGETGEIILVDVKVEALTKGGEAEKEQTNW